MSLLVWEMEWRLARARRRLLMFNVVVPLALVAPLAFGAAPAFHAAAVYAVLFVTFGTFGAAIPLVRDAESGLVARVLSAGVAPRALLLQRAAAGALLDTAQLLPALGLAIWGADGSVQAWLLVTIVLAGTLWVTNLLGAVVAATARSVAEAALLGAVASMLLLHASGVFRTPTPGSLGAGFEAAGPFRALHEAVLGISSGSGAGAASLAIWAMALPLLVAVAAPWLARSLRHARGA